MLEPNLYRLRVNARPAWVDYRSCTLGISVGQPYHEGEKFAATVEWAARHFEEIRVDVSDTLQRHRLIGEGMSPGEAEAVSRREGDLWIAAATPTLAECGRAYAIIRWDAWLRHPDFLAVFDAYTGLAQSDAVLRTAIASDIEGFIARHMKRGMPIQNETWVRAASHAYLIEELAVITLQGATQRSARIYPGPELECFRVVRAGRVPDAPAGLDRDYYVHVNLEHRKTLPLRPQAEKIAAVPRLDVA